MKWRSLIFVLLVSTLLILAACGKKECEVSADCEPQPGMVARCTADNECRYVEKKTTPTAPPAPKEDVGFFTSDVRSLGNTFQVDTTVTTPFEINEDLVDVKILLKTIATGYSEFTITKIELMGVDKKTRQKIRIGEKTVNKPLWIVDDFIEEQVRVAFPTAEKRGTFSNVEAVITYDVVFMSRGVPTDKTSTMKSLLRRFELDWTKSASAQCPASCDDGNQITEDVCDASTGFFCEHNYLPNNCGNYICERGETQCNCGQDCGPCSGDIGEFLEQGCVQNTCLSQIKQGVTSETKNIVDERRLSAFTLSNQFVYNEPFNANRDTIAVEVALFERGETIAQVRIANIQLLEGTNLLSEAQVKKILPSIGSAATADLTVPKQTNPEVSKALTVRVWYEWVREVEGKDPELSKGKFDKSLGRITIISPDI